MKPRPTGQAGDATETNADTRLSSDGHRFVIYAAYAQRLNTLMLYRKTAHRRSHAFHSKEPPLIRNTYPASAVSVALLATVCGCSSSSFKGQMNTGGTPPASVVATGGYIVSVFASATQAEKSKNPDSII